MTGYDTTVTTVTCANHFNSGQISPTRDLLTMGPLASLTVPLVMIGKIFFSVPDALGLCSDSVHAI